MNVEINGIKLFLESFGYLMKVVRHHLFSITYAAPQAQEADCLSTKRSFSSRLLRLPPFPTLVGRMPIAKAHK